MKDSIGPNSERLRVVLTRVLFRVRTRRRQTRVGGRSRRPGTRCPEGKKFTVPSVGGVGIRPKSDTEVGIPGTNGLCEKGE